MNCARIPHAVRALGRFALISVLAWLSIRMTRLTGRLGRFTVRLARSESEAAEAERARVLATLAKSEQRQ